MIEAQIISKLLNGGDIELLLNENISSDYFITYNKEAKFIYNHYNEYRKLPTKETFLGKFNEFEFVSDKEDWNYLILGLRESYMFNQLAQTLNGIVKDVEEDSLSAYQKLKNKIAELEDIRPITSNDIIKNAKDRLDTFNKKIESDTANTIPIGLKEIDDAIGGWQLGEELVTIMARTNQGKSWILIDLLMNAWKEGKRVGLYSGEMSSEQVGYRFDALYQHFSNLALMRGSKEEKEKYEKYIEELQKAENCFVVITPKDLGHQATVNDIDFMIKKYNLDIVGIDQFSLMQDYRTNYKEQLRIKLGNISQDLFNLSMKYHIPVLALSQANRAAAKTDTPELEHMSESDAISQNSSKVISMSRVGQELKLEVVKNRYGSVGGQFVYLWDIDKGEFKFSRYGNEKTASKEDESLSRRNNEEESPF